MRDAAVRAWATASRVVGAVVGGLAVSLAGSICVAVLTPDARGLGLALGMALVLPVWAAAMSVLLLGRSARRVWLASGVVTAGLCAAIAVVVRVR